MADGKPAYVYTGSEWIPIGLVIGAKYQSASPTTSTMGDLWIDSDNLVVHVWNGTTWDQVRYSGPIQTRWTKTVSGGETSLSGTDNNNISLEYTPGYEEVYLNGVLLARGSDYTATTGTSITGLTALTSGDIVEIIAFQVASIHNTYSKAEANGLFLLQSEANGLFLLQSSASTTYATKNDLTQVEALGLLGL